MAVLGWLLATGFAVAYFYVVVSDALYEAERDEDDSRGEAQ